MQAIWLTSAAVAVGLFVLVVGLGWSPGEPAPTAHPVLEQMERMLDGTLAPQPRRSFVERFRSSLLAGGASDVAVPMSSQRREGLEDALEKADIKMRPDEWMLIMFGIFAVLFILFAWRVHPLVGLGVAVVVPLFGGRFYLNFRAQRRNAAFAKQLPDVMIQLSNSLRAGHSFAQAMAAVATSARAPLGPEFTRAVQEMHLGVPVEDALRRLVERNDSDDLDLAISAVNLARVVGGNLAEMLDNIAETIRERVRIRGEIRTLTAQARFSGWIITLLPLALAGFLAVIAPDYFTPMLKDGLGWAMMTAGVISMLIGLFFIRRIVDIKLW
jgi:tight adherence protein B